MDNTDNCGRTKEPRNTQLFCLDLPSVPAGTLPGSLPGSLCHETLECGKMWQINAVNRNKNVVGIGDSYYRVFQPAVNQYSIYQSVMSEYDVFYRLPKHFMTI